MALVSAELGRFQPEPMPADLAARVDAALAIPPTELGADSRATFLDVIAAGADPASPAADTTLTSAGHERAAVADAEPVAPDRAQPPVPHLTLVGDGGTRGDVSNPVPEKAPGGRRLRWAAPIAVAAGVIAFVGFGLDYLAGRSTHSSSDSSSAGAGSAEKRADAPSIAGSPLQGAQLLASGTDYTRAMLGVAPVEPMTAPFTAQSASPPVRKAPGALTDTGSALRRLTAPAALDDCLRAIELANSGGTLSVESVDFARFSGAPAVIVRFTAANGHWAWASGADCGTPAGGAATLDKVPVG
jgi:hypothetical protein